MPWQSFVYSTLCSYCEYLFFQICYEAVVDAVFKELINSHGLTKNGPETILFGGGSAGARGVMVHHSTIYQRLG